MGPKKTAGDILRAHRGAKKLSQDEVAKRLGLKDQQNVQKWESKKARKRIPPKHYPALVEMLDIPVFEFLEATPEPGFTDALRACVAEGLVEAGLIREGRPPFGYSPGSSGTPMAATMIPVVGFVAGDPDSDIAWEPMDPPRTTHFAGCNALEVQGDSMEPVALAGQLVVYDPRVDVHDGDLAIIKLKSGETLFKRVFWDEDDRGLLNCQSIKPTLRPRNIRETKIDELHKVVGVKFA
jgi:SOS-response transcriptional repressor LexA